MQRRVSTYVYADDPILQAGVISQLRMRAEIDVVESGDLNGVDVGIAVADTLDEETIRILRSLKKAGVGYTILVMSAIDDGTVVTAAEVGVSGLLRRGEATPDVLVRTIQKVAAGEGVIPSGPARPPSRSGGPAAAPGALAAWAHLHRALGSRDSGAAVDRRRARHERDRSGSCATASAR